MLENDWTEKYALNQNNDIALTSFFFTCILWVFVEKSIVTIYYDLDMILLYHTSLITKCRMG